jgi:hypothetical protein
MSDPTQPERGDEETVAGTIDDAVYGDRRDAVDGTVTDALPGDREDEPVDVDLDADSLDSAAADEQAAREGTKGMPDGEV